ncbi:MAG TPA: tRNA (uridine(34)/cytosine(34)/5-carboxymethylaminomethyluridine(34)-2'-O)-methyltransferase TrmL [Ureibacillus sp.]|nr:tRNA (uridine(34)/cytosine(34)/5-carboxymethylaminomethyluridine(34)-2'-O)-methyltransferase TrmL [Ureibacillus sp.]
MAIHVVLYQPEIPANTANIALTCAATDTALHLIRPLGFSTDEKMIKQAGLDFWQLVNITYYESLDDFFSKNQGEFYYIETFGEKTHSAFDFSNVSKEHYFMFGKETTGLPKDLLEKNEDHFLRIPMSNHVRSLNLSNTAAILVYEALRQQGYPHLK